MVADTASSIVELAQARFATGRGGTIFLAGGTGAGQSLAFDCLPAALGRYRRPPVLLRGAIVDGAYVASGPQKDAPGSFSAAVQLAASLAAFSGPLGALLGQIVGSMSDAQRFLREFSRGRNAVSSGPRVLQSAIRALADQRPLCFAVECGSPVVADWWLNLVEGLSAEAEVELPLLIVLAIEAPASSPPQDDDESSLSKLVRLLVDGGRAEWWEMPSVDEAAINELIERCTPDLGEKLCAIASGQAGWVVELFADWRRRSVIVTNGEGLWTFDHANLAEGLAMTSQIVDTRMRELLGENSSSFRKSKRLLALGALQGEAFFLEPIAELLGVELAACEDLAAELTQREGRRALLETIPERTPGARDVTTSRGPRYRFTDGLVRSSLNRYGLSDTERRDAAAKCAAVLERTSDPAPIAAVLASLHAAAGDHVESWRWSTMAGLSAAGELLHWQTQAVIEDEQRWEHLTGEQARQAARFLLDASVQLSRVRPWDELFGLLDAVVRLARIHDLGTEHCAALRLQGKVYAASGDYERAREGLDAAERILGPTGDKGERHRLLCEFAYLDNLEGDSLRASERLGTAIAEARSVADEPAEAAALEQRGQIMLEYGEANDAQRSLALALRIYRKLEDSNGVSASLMTMSAVQVVQGDVGGAVHSLREALALAQNTGNKARELMARKHLGALLDDPAAAYVENERGLLLARELNDVPAEADCLLSLGRRALALRLWDDAGRVLQEGFDLRTRLTDPVGAAWCLREIGVLQICIGALPQARRNLEVAQKSFATRDAQDGLAAVHNALGNLEARAGNRRAAEREFALAASRGAPLENGGRVVQVVHQVRPLRSWHPEE